MVETNTDIWSIVFGGIHQVAEKRKMKYAHELERFQKELYDEINKIRKNLLNLTYKMWLQHLKILNTVSRKKNLGVCLQI